MLLGACQQLHIVTPRESDTADRVHGQGVGVAGGKLGENTPLRVTSETIHYTQFTFYN